MNDTSTPKEMVAEAYLSRLGERGIEYVFANAGTDFAPIVEALSRPSGGKKFPRFITVPHENVAMAMAHGYYRTCGKPAAVMVHVTVGTANSMNGLINAARDNIPLLLAAGRTAVPARASGDPVLLAAGDVGNCSTIFHGDEDTAKLIQREPTAPVVR